jgi:hypothetical protein
MSNILVLDAAYPPSPKQWVADMDAVGAQGGAIYVYGSFLNYTKAHVDVARAAGKQVLPIIVPGNQPPAPPLYAVAAPYGITSGPLAYDIEDGSFPAPEWVEQAVNESNAAGWSAGVYSSGAARQQYAFGWWWEARWPYGAGTWQPVPVLPTGQAGWQYAHDVVVNGSEYDISIFDMGVFEEANPSSRTGDAGMGFLSRDVTGGTIDDVYVSDGEARWGVYPGGAGDWIASGVTTNLGSPGDAKDLVEVTGAFTTHEGALRLNLRGVRRDGSRWVRVMDPVDFSTLLDWAVTAGGLAQDVLAPSVPDDDSSHVTHAQLDAAFEAAKVASNTTVRTAQMTLEDALKIPGR